jgi:hypothetical protein
MTYREVAMWEILEVLRRVGRGENKSEVARTTGQSRKTVRHEGGLLRPTHLGVDFVGSLEQVVALVSELPEAFPERHAGSAKCGDRQEGDTSYLTPLLYCCTAANYDGGAPISVFAVLRELGHRSIDLIETTYGHLLDVRNRSSVVEYRETEVVQLSTAHRAESA